MRAVDDSVGRRPKAVRPTKIANGPARSDSKQTFVADNKKSHISFNMSEVNEHSDSEFYYPEDLSDLELLRQPTFFENREKQPKPLMKKFAA